MSIYKSGSQPCIIYHEPRSTEASAVKPYSHKGTPVDLEQLMVDIKIKPTFSGSLPPQEAIRSLKECLQSLKSVDCVADELKSIALQVQFMERKLRGFSVCQSAVKAPLNVVSQNRQRNASPMRALVDESASRILYTNYSLKSFEKPEGTQRSIVSQFQEEDIQVHQINRDLGRLEEMLAAKGLGDKKYKENRPGYIARTNKTVQKVNCWQAANIAVVKQLSSQKSKTCFFGHSTTGEPFPQRKMQR